MKTNEKEFYETVAEILNTETIYKHWPFKSKNRWNNRNAGNGRYEGRGTVRMFSDSLFYISLRNPSINKICHSREEVFDFLRNLSEDAPDT